MSQKLGKNEANDGQQFPDNRQEEFIYISIFSFISWQLY